MPALSDRGRVDIICRAGIRSCAHRLLAHTQIIVRCGYVMKGSGDNAGEQRAHVMRWGMRRLVFVSIAMVLSMLAVALSTDTLTFFSGNTAHNLIYSRSSSSSSASSTTPRASVLPLSSSSLVSTESLQFSSAPVPLQTSSSIASQSTARGCDYTMGRWVKDEKGPLYSGRSCKRWLSGMWACRLMPSRPNFNYENYRWQPDGCNLPAFDSQEFLTRMRNKVVAFVGDSIGRQQFQSLMCMLTGGDDKVLVEDVSKLFGLVKPRGAIRADGMAQRFTKTNTTVLYYWSASLCEIQPLNRSNPHTKYAMHLDRPATFIQKYLPVMDVLILNTGHHWNRGKLEANKWVMHVNGRPNTNRRFERDVPSARTLTVPKIAAWLQEQREKKATKAEIYIRTLSPRHFFNGDWDSGGRCDDDFIPVQQSNVTGHGSDPIVESAVSGTSLHMLGVTYASQFRFDAHLSKYRPHQRGQDCLHWCLPGVPDFWNELLYADLLSHENAAKEA